MIHGNFDFFVATGGGNGVDGAGAETATAGGAGGGCGATTSPVVRAGGCIGGGAGVGGGGGVTEGGGGGGGAGREMSEVFGLDPVGPVVGPVLRGNATVAELSTIVAYGSGRSRLVGLSDGAFKSIDVARIVAFGSKVCGAISKPPSNVQNF